ncbi:MAG: hypothetical protein E7566_07090 [Ruminococcaceae bacterium]|nr:hypothetical protein [Oscillospiraceae bacterium]
MKKIVVLALAVLMLASVTACTSENNKSKDNTSITVLPTLAVDMDSTGVVAENPAPMDSGKIIIGNKEYVFPMLVSELTEDGWYFDENARERLSEMELIPTRSTETLADMNLFHDEYAGGLRLMLLGVYNEGDEPAELRDCYLGAMAVNATMAANPEDINIVLPGGITFKSTASDVVSVYGDADNHPDFFGAQLDSSSAEYRGEYFNVSFTFEEDGRINYLQYSKYVNLE